MIDEDIQLLRVLSDTATSIFLNKKSNIARINSLNILEDEKQNWINVITEPLDETLYFLQIQIRNILSRIPIFNYFLSQQKGINIFDSAQLISIIVDIDNFDEFKNLMSYSGMVPYATNYNKKLYKLLLKIGYKLIQNNEQYQFIYEMQLEKYRKEKPRYSEKHIENMAKRIVIKKFLKNLYVSWKAVDKGFDN